MIFHIVTPSYWQTFDDKDVYFSETFNDEKFIHCSTIEQLPGVLQRYYKNAGEVVKLTINEEKLTTQPIYEAAANGEEFPHIYGGINKSAITEIKKLVEISEGKYTLSK